MVGSSGASGSAHTIQTSPDALSGGVLAAYTPGCGPYPKDRLHSKRSTTLRPDADCSRLRHVEGSLPASLLPPAAVFPRARPLPIVREGSNLLRTRCVIFPSLSDRRVVLPFPRPRPRARASREMKPKKPEGAHPRASWLAYDRRGKRRPAFFRLRFIPPFSLAPLLRSLCSPDRAPSDHRPTRAGGSPRAKTQARGGARALGRRLAAWNRDAEKPENAASARPWRARPGPNPCEPVASRGGGGARGAWPQGPPCDVHAVRRQAPFPRLPFFPQGAARAKSVRGARSPRAFAHAPGQTPRTELQPAVRARRRRRGAVKPRLHAASRGLARVPIAAWGAPRTVSKSSTVQAPGHTQGVLERALRSSRLAVSSLRTRPPRGRPKSARALSQLYTGYREIGSHTGCPSGAAAAAKFAGKSGTMGQWISVARVGAEGAVSGMQRVAAGSCVIGHASCVRSWKAINSERYGVQAATTRRDRCIVQQEATRVCACGHQTNA